MSKPEQFLSAIHNSLAMSVVGESHQYVTKLVLRARREEFYETCEDLRNPSLSIFLDMHVEKPLRAAGVEMFEGALAVWEPGKRVVISARYRNAEPGMLDPIIDSIRIVP